MFILTLELNNQCNLNCSYCYKGVKTNLFMNLKTTQEAIVYAVNAVQEQHRDKKLKINFLGGEPLISFDLIKEIVSFCEGYASQIIFSYTITTNGILLDKVIVDYLIEKKIRIKLSLDGDRYIHNLNRVNYYGGGSYDQIIEKFDLLCRYENLSQTYIQVSNVITKNNYQYLFSSIKHNLSKGFRYLDSGMDSTENWDDNELAMVETKILDAIQYYIFFNINHEPVIWSFFDKIFYATKPLQRLHSCGAGIVSIYVSPEGKVYPCPGAIGTNLMLGNINERVILDSIKKSVNALSEKNNECRSCHYSDKCKGRVCFVDNIKVNGDLSKVTKLNCWFTKFSNKVILQYTDILAKHSCFSRYNFL